MPNIQDYNAPNLGLQPTETGVETVARSAYRVGAFYNQTANAIEGAGQAIGRGVRDAGDVALNAITHQEISHGMKTGAELLLNAENQWNQTAKTTDPNNVSVAGQFREETLEPKLDQFVNQFHTEKGQQWAQEYADRIRQHMARKTQADMSSRAAKAIGDNAVGTINTLATTAYNDPSSLDMAADTLKHTLNGVVSSSPTITAEGADTVHEHLTRKGMEQIVKAAIAGTIAKGGDYQHILNDPKYSQYVNVTEVQGFARQEKIYRSAEAADVERARRLQKEQATDKSADLRDNKYIPDITGDNPQATRKDILNDHDLTWEDRTRLTGLIDKEDKPTTHDDPATVDGLMRVVSDPNVSLDQAKVAVITAALSKDKGIRPQTRTELTQLATDLRNLNDPLLTRDMAAAKELVEPTIPGVPAGLGPNPGAYAKFYADFIHNQYLPAKVAGTLPFNALDLSDEKSMIRQAITKATGGVDRLLPAAISANGGVGAPPLPVYTAPTNKPAAPPKISTKADYDKLPSGSTFIGDDGKPYRKP